MDDLVKVAAYDHVGCKFRTGRNNKGTKVDESSYNPIQKMLDDTIWDGRDRITELLDLVMRVQEADKIYITKWLHQCIAMALNGTVPNTRNKDNKDNASSTSSTSEHHKGWKGRMSKRLKVYGADGVLVLQGDQGIGKTMLCSKIAVYDDWFMEGVSIDMGNKDSIIQATSCWIAELGEIAR